MKYRKLILALSGAAFSGKDTFGKFLINNFNFTRVGLADGVRDVAYAINPFVYVEGDFITNHRDVIFYHKELISGRAAHLVDGSYFKLQPLVNAFGWDEAKKIIEVRELLQRTGTEAGRDIISETLWTDLAEKRMAELDKIVITDCRFPSEADWIHSLGGKVIRINRKGVGSVNSHVSDQRLDSKYIDYEIHNNGTLEELETEANNLFRKIKVNYLVSKF